MTRILFTDEEVAALRRASDLLRDAAKHSDVLSLPGHLKAALRSAVDKIEAARPIT